MYKQIIETFEPKLTFEQKNIDAEFAHYVNDKVLLERCKEISTPMLKAGMNINKICELVIDFQRKYMHIDKCDKNASKDYTVGIWYKMLSDNFDN